MGRETIVFGGICVWGYFGASFGGGVDGENGLRETRSANVF